MKYTWRVIHEVVGNLEEALNRLQKDDFQVYQILSAGETRTAFVVVGRKEARVP
jgi:hypothetical protein